MPNAMPDANFELDPRLAADCEWVLDWPLCRLLLMRDARYPWFILVPRRAQLRELCQLNTADSLQFSAESRRLSEFMLQHCSAEKLNIAALGNVVAQLHIHHIARFSSDAAWPAPVWGAYPPETYTDEALQQLLTLARQQLSVSG